MKIHLLDARETLIAIHDQIIQILEEVYHKADQQIPLQPLDVTVRASRSSMPELIINGGCFEPGLINLFISPEVLIDKVDIREELASTFAHELHHASRWDGPGYGETLGEALVSEGLAGFFARELTGAPPAPWETVPTSELEPFHKRANEEWNNPDYNHWEWFFGSADFPRWVGYGIGHMIASAYLQATGKTAAQSVFTEHENFHPYLREDINRASTPYNSNQEL